METIESDDFDIAAGEQEEVNTAVEEVLRDDPGNITEVEKMLGVLKYEIYCIDMLLDNETGEGPDRSDLAEAVQLYVANIREGVAEEDRDYQLPFSDLGLIYSLMGLHSSVIDTEGESGSTNVNDPVSALSRDEDLWEKIQTILRDDWQGDLSLFLGDESVGLTGFSKELEAGEVAVKKRAVEEFFKIVKTIEW